MAYCAMQSPNGASVDELNGICGLRIVECEICRDMTVANDETTTTTMLRCSHLFFGFVFLACFAFGALYSVKKI